MSNGEDKKVPAFYEHVWKLYIFQKLFFCNPFFNYADFFRKIDKETYSHCRGYIALQMYGKKALKEMLSICNKYDMKPCLLYGSLLGYQRNKGFIPHDSDIDMGLLEKDFEKINLLRDAILKKGYTLRVQNEYGIAFRKPGFKGLNIDLFLIRKENNEFVVSAGLKSRWATRYYSKDVFVELVKVKFLDSIEVFIPNLPEQYLKDNYGSWEKPRMNYQKKSEPTGKIELVDDSA